ncbi:hypothetical protein CJ179_38610 [Rhodococcus sp. ACS1]|uniref:hypothetical protein n=1 Tax=Rhodococcus sp. ACS1 TaxID=2028570 RepID=UPI000BB14B02|nr:hypothetical protein [Rhodococcus sp. ACS1]PBC38513.1 hypothetical protein CJ179_38610 [Rhodococcus sp. ACS1]
MSILPQPKPASGVIFAQDRDLNLYIGQSTDVEIRTERDFNDDYGYFNEPVVTLRSQTVTYVCGCGHEVTLRPPNQGLTWQHKIVRGAAHDLIIFRALGPLCPHWTHVAHGKLAV